MTGLISPEERRELGDLLRRACLIEATVSMVVLLALGAALWLRVEALLS